MCLSWRQRTIATLCPRGYGGQCVTVCHSCMQANLFKEALESCQAVLKEDPDNVKALFRTGKVSQTTSDHKMH